MYGGALCDMNPMKIDRRGHVVVPFVSEAIRTGASVLLLIVCIVRRSRVPTTLGC